MNRKSGFTLIELLVVIAIIAVLASVVMTNLNSSRVKARNARRASDIRELISAFNLGVTPTVSLPDNGAGKWSCVSASCYEGYNLYLSDATVDSFLLANISSKPIDPPGGKRSAGGYIYQHTSSGGRGPLLMWLAEPPVTPNICGPGTVEYVATGFYVSCVVRITP